MKTSQKLNWCLESKLLDDFALPSFWSPIRLLNNLLSRKFDCVALDLARESRLLYGVRDKRLRFRGSRLLMAELFHCARQSGRATNLENGQPSNSSPGTTGYQTVV